MPGRSRTAVTRRDWIALAVVMALLALWLLTGCRYGWLRHLITGLTLLYILVIRVVLTVRRPGKNEK